MYGRGTIFGLIAICALLGSAIAAQSAGAITGTTAFTCKSGAGEGGTTFVTNHCRSSETSGSFGHNAIPANTATEVTGSNELTSMKLKATVAGLPITITAINLTAIGSMENRVDFITGEHYVHGYTTIELTNVSPSLVKCYVHKDEEGKKGVKGSIKSEKLTVTTGQGDSVKFAPAEGAVLARFWLLDFLGKTPAEGGECPIGGTYNLSGTVVGTPDGATTTFNHAATTSQNTLQLGFSGGALIKAGLEGSIAFEGRDPAIGGDTFKPLSATTVST